MTDTELWPLLDVPGLLLLTQPFGRFARETTPAEMVICPDCDDGHMEELVVRAGSYGTKRFFIYCPENLRVEIDPEELRRWQINLPAIAAELAEALALSGDVKQLVADRLWRLGRTKWRETQRDVLFARGLHWRDAEHLLTSIAKTRRPIVLVPNRLPDLISAISLSDVAVVRDERIEIDVAEIIATVGEHDDREEVAPTLDDQYLKTLVRRQVKAEEKSSLTDAVLVRAYQQFGSMRKAADFLTAETGELVTKDKVQRAVNRSGGIETLVRPRQQSCNP